jgi:hypothetical protein
LPLEKLAGQAESWKSPPTTSPAYLLREDCWELHDSRISDKLPTNGPRESYQVRARVATNCRMAHSDLLLLTAIPQTERPPTKKASTDFSEEAF